VSRKAKKKRCINCPDHCYCGSSKHLEDNNIAGRQHFPGLWVPFCRKDHAEFHTNCARARVDFGKQINPIMQCLQALKALLVGLWMVVEQLEKHAKSQSEVKDDERNS